MWQRVQQSPTIGEASRRRIMYIPIVTGAFKPKHAGSPTPFYHKVAQLKPAYELGKYNLVSFIKKLSALNNIPLLNTLKK